MLKMVVNYWSLDRFSDYLFALGLGIIVGATVGGKVVAGVGFVVVFVSLLLSVWTWRAEKQRRAR